MFNVCIFFCKKETLGFAVIDSKHENIDRIRTYARTIWDDQEIGAHRMNSTKKLEHKT